MRRLHHSLTLLIILGASLGLTGAASAHVSKEANGMYAILHIQPDDDPTAGQPNQLIFYLGSDQPQYIFSLANCQCSLRLTEAGKTIASTTLTSEAGSDTTGQAMLTFPKLGVYNVTLTAHAKDASFPAFALTYPVRVDQSTVAAVRHGHKVTQYAIIGLGVLGAIGIGGWQLLERRRR